MSSLKLCLSCNQLLDKETQFPPGRNQCRSCKKRIAAENLAAKTISGETRLCLGHCNRTLPLDKFHGKYCGGCYDAIKNGKRPHFSTQLVEATEEEPFRETKTYNERQAEKQKLFRQNNPEVGKAYNEKRVEERRILASLKASSDVNLASPTSSKRILVYDILQNELLAKYPSIKTLGSAIQVVNPTFIFTTYDGVFRSKWKFVVVDANVYNSTVIDLQHQQNFESQFIEIKSTPRVTKSVTVVASDGTYQDYESISKAAVFFSMSMNGLKKVIEKGNVYKGYTIKYK